EVRAVAGPGHQRPLRVPLRPPGALRVLLRAAPEDDRGDRGQVGGAAPARRGVAGPGPDRILGRGGGPRATSNGRRDRSLQAAFQGPHFETPHLTAFIARGPPSPGPPISASGGSGLRSALPASRTPRRPPASPSPRGPPWRLQPRPGAPRLRPGTRSGPTSPRRRRSRGSG